MKLKLLSRDAEALRNQRRIRSSRWFSGVNMNSGPHGIGFDVPLFRLVWTVQNESGALTQSALHKRALTWL